MEFKDLFEQFNTEGKFSYHLVRTAPNMKIGNHAHTEQLETHEVIAGNGACMNGNTEITYQPGVISILFVKLYCMKLPLEVRGCICLLNLCLP